MSAEGALGTWALDETCARAAWSRLAEPGDAVAGALVGALGAVDALRWVADVLPASPRPGSGAAAGQGGPVLGTGAVPRRAGGEALDASVQRRLGAAVDRWSTRWDRLDPRRDLDQLHALGGRLLHPGSPSWPAPLDDLGVTAPPCLWVRGRTDLAGLVDRSVALVGARACTAYGEHVATELAAGLAERGFTIVSGGAYGIDAAAHRGAVGGGGPTVVLLAGGVDRPYPAGNAALLRRVVEAGGAVVSEVPPGGVPTRSRFLLRNRLIAAASRATVVVEAAWRSGALSTAGHAAALLRPVGAVPGPVTSMASAGCHRILREGSAVCVTDAGEVAELAGAVGGDLAPDRHGATDELDGLDPASRRVLDGLPVRQGAAVASIARTAGVAEAEVRAALGVLEMAGLAVPQDGGWRRALRDGWEERGRCDPAL